MSRHIAKKSDDHFIAYGYDHPLQEYFYQEWGPAREENGEIKMVAWAGSRMTDMSRGEMLDKLTEFGAPETHMESVALDLPF